LEVIKLLPKKIGENEVRILDKIKEAFKPFCTKIVEIKTEKEFKS